MPLRSRLPETVEAATRKHVLIVDDEPAVRRLLCDVFADEGYVVSQAPDGEQALKQVQLFKPSIVIVDLMMPIMSGWAFAQACHDLEGYADLPIILLSAMYEVGRKTAEINGLGLCACLPKPFNVSELLALVELHARSSPACEAPGPVARRRGQGPARVLLVLDRPTLRELASLTLQHASLTTRTVSCATEARAVFATWQPCLVVLDMNLDGVTLVQHISEHEGGWGRTPVIGLTRRNDLKTTLAAYDAGVADVLTFPFSPEELLARAMAVVRRSYPGTLTFNPTLRLGELEIDIFNRTVRAGAAELHLTSLEQSLLYLLAANAGRVISHADILDTLWGADFVAEAGIVDREIRNLRARLLHDWKQPEVIATVPGGGYQFVPAVTSKFELAQPAGSRLNHQ